MTVIGTIVKSKNGKHILHSCVDCGKERWTPLLRGKPSRLRCLPCAVKLMWQTTRKHTPITSVPVLGEIRMGRDLGIKDRKHRYIYAICPMCNKQRWVISREPGRDYHIRCHSCAMASNAGEANSRWKGGTIRSSGGYINVKSRPSDFFYPMASSHGYIFEHRLVMAKHLNRCLLPWEIVHHVNGVKSDNRLENLQLLPAKKYHISDTLIKSLVTKYKKRIVYLESILNNNNINYTGACHSQGHHIKEINDTIRKG